MPPSDKIFTSHDQIWRDLSYIPDNWFLNGKTAAYWHIVSVLNDHLIKDQFTLNIDDWDVVGKVYDLIDYVPSPNSTAIKITYSYDGETHCRVVAKNQIEWIEKETNVSTSS